MTAEDDEDWARAAAELEEAPTRVDQVGLDDLEVSRPTPAEVAAEAVPQPVAPRDSTGKYQTLQGYEVARETIERVAFEKGLQVGREQERRFLLMGFQLAQLQTGRATPEHARMLAELLGAWASRPENARLVNVTLGWPEDGPKEDDR